MTMTDTSFLSRVARVYAGLPQDQLCDYCFVLPNKRSIAFLRRHFTELKKGEPFIEPALMDISEFIAGFSDKAEASRYEMIFTLFNCYARLNKDAETSFDKFLYWGEMLINDFNDVDRYLVDPDMLFTNLERLKEIGSNYLTPEQVEIIRRYWDAENIETETGRFWKHLDGESGSKARFIKLWEVLGPLYHDYMDSLAAEGLTTRGAMYREAAARIATEGSDALPYSRYIFVGFNVLTTSELKIFRRIQAMGRGDFFWDFNSPALLDPANKAGRFIRRNMEEFPSPEEFEDEPLTAFPDIDIIGVPSNVGQTKVAGKIIGRWQAGKHIDTGEGHVNTAVVLPDESLFLPLIHSMPEEVTSMNITMGFPMRLSPMAALIGNIRKLQRNARRTAGAVDAYYYEDVKALLVMPLVSALDPDGAAEILDAIRRERLFTVPVSVITERSERLAVIFKPISRYDTPADVTRFISDITEFLLDNAEDTDPIQKSFLKSYASAVATLTSATDRFGVKMDAFTFLQMADRAVRGDSVNFVGEPLKGLQIMGMLETRSLDFENIIVTSMNERIFPRRMVSKSFIPDVLRRGYGMATTDFSESIFAYYFYRLIARAKRVALLYDSRTVGGTRSSEMSRYLVQLMYLSGKKARHFSAVMSPPVFSAQQNGIVKTTEIMEKLARFTRRDSGIALSASALNTYINCPLQFYLQYVERFFPDDEPADYMDASTYGRIVHQVFENFYPALGRRDGKPEVDPAVVSLLTRPDYPLLDQLLLEAVNNHYHGVSCPAEYRRPAGETAVLSTVIKQGVTDVLLAEKDFGKFRFEDAELKLDGTITTSGGLTVNVRQVIDRIDRIACPESPTGTRLRIVDYKTGSDALSAKSVDELFDPNSNHRPKAIMQLLFYCMFYAAMTGNDEPIQPLIYSMRSIPLNGITPLKIAGRTITDYHEVIDEFKTGLDKLIHEMFSPEVPFTAAKEGSQACTFCQFKAVCTQG